MKKALKKDITRYDEKMKLRVDLATLKAVGISVAVAAPIFLLLYFTAGMIPAVFVSFIVALALVILQIGKIDGISLAQYIGKMIRFVFFPKERKKHYSHDSGEYRIRIMTEQEQKHKERSTAQNVHKKKVKKKARRQAFAERQSRHKERARRSSFS